MNEKSDMFKKYKQKKKKLIKKIYKTQNPILFNSIQFLIFCLPT